MPASTQQQAKSWSHLFIFLGLYFIIWSIAPVFLASSVALDVSEGINWGSEWQWGYYKHPPLSSWILYSFYQLFGHIGPYLLSQLCIILTLCLIYRLGCQLWSKQTALLGSTLTLAVVYYTYPSLEFNHNVAQFPIWAGLYLVFYQAITRGRLSNWLWLGILGGLGMLTKYSVIFLLIPMALYLMLPKQWHLLKQPYPWIAAVLMLIIFAPHLYWLMTHEWLPLSYANGRSHDVSESASSISRHFSWVNFVFAQLIAHIPLLLMMIFNRKQLSTVSIYRQNMPTHAPLLWYLWAAPILVLMVLSLFFGIGLRDMWGMPMWALSGLLAASIILPAAQALVAAKYRRALMIWLTIATLLSMVYVGFGDSIRHKPSRMQWPEQALATKAQMTWQQLSSCPLDSVSGEGWLSALVAMNSGFPSQMISGPASYSPWMNTKRLQENGTLVMWEADTDTMLPLLNELQVASPNDKTINGLIKTQGQWQVVWRDPHAKTPLMVNWTAYVPARCVPTT